MKKIRIGISSCLLGEKVRYDGGDKLDAYLIENLGNYAEFVPVCPEVECGMPAPREPMRLTGAPAAPRLVTINTKLDFTEKLSAWAKKRVIELEKENLSGFVFKSRSPSCGARGVEVFSEDGVPAKIGTGIFAKILMDKFPLLPLGEEGDLHDPDAMKKFLQLSGYLKSQLDNL
ncbi:MAG: DUF523 domain-containing protein [Nitrospirota bacterium]